MKIGLYFGTFNPIHIGHLIIASFAVNNTDLQQVWLIVSPQNPLKQSEALLNDYDRLHYVRLAVEDNSQLRASDVEFNLPKPSYTIDTLTYLDEKYQQHQFVLIIGSDSFQNLAKWKNYELLSKYNIIVYERPEYRIKENLTKNITVLNAPLLNLSATLIRTLLKQGKPVRYLVPENIREELESNLYFKANTLSSKKSIREEGKLKQ
ncbi:MAG: nicotinate (nicotinamide) nucleotide adenylyltransferase [Chitinophagaceae bacterium]